MIRAARRQSGDRVTSTGLTETLTLLRSHTFRGNIDFYESALRNALLDELAMK